MWFLAHEMRREHHARRQLLVVEAHAPHRLLDDGLLVGLVVDGKVAVSPSSPMRRASMSRRSTRTQKQWKVAQQRLGQRTVPEQLVHPLGHLGGGLVGERDGQDGVGRNVRAPQ